MYQEKSSKLFLSFSFAVTVCPSSVCRSPSSFFVGKENNFHSGTRCCVAELCDDLSWLL